MEILHSVYVTSHEYLSDAYIYSIKPVKPKEIKKLLYAQKIIEAMWLEEYPVVIFLSKKSRIKYSTKLYGPVELVYPRGWEEINESETILINERMYAFCRIDKAPFVNIDIASDSIRLLELFKQEVFVVATVNNIEGEQGDV